jgi:hypothetical protein
MQITIMAEEGQITVEADGKEPYMCSTAAECSDYVAGLLAEAGFTEEPPAEAGEMDDEAMWDEEAAKRAPQSNLMA